MVWTGSSLVLITMFTLTANWAKIVFLYPLRLHHKIAMFFNSWAVTCQFLTINHVIPD